MRLNHRVAWNNILAARSETVSFCTEIMTCGAVVMPTDQISSISVCNYTGIFPKAYKYASGEVR